MKTTSNPFGKLARSILVVALLVGMATCSFASSTIIMSYNAGSNGVPAIAPDPTSVEGGSWDLLAANLNGTTALYEGLSPDPLHSSLNTWRTLDNLTTAGGARWAKSPTDEAVTNAIWCGWKASAYWRVTDPVPGNAGSVAVFFSFGSTNPIMNRRYTCLLDIDANGALYATTTTTTSTITTNTTDALAYHLYEIAYDSATRTAQLRVDGQVINSNWPSLTIPASVHGCHWGAGSTAGRGDGYYNNVKVEVNDLAPTTVTLDPANATNDVAESVTFAADFTGCATNLQWYKDSSPIPGANQRSYTVASIVPSDAGEYWMGIADPQTGTEVTTAHATLTVNPDSNPPTVASVQPDLSLQHVRVQFSEGMDPTTAQNPANYQVAGGTSTVTNATLLGLLTVDLQLAPELTAGSNYDLILSGIQDQSGNTILTVTQAITAPNLVTVSLYDAGTLNNPVEAPNPSTTNGGRWYIAGTTNDFLTVGGVSPDVDGHFNGWNINDNDSSGGGFQYRMDYPQASHDFARTNGWRLKVRCRMIDDYGNATSAIGALYSNPAGRRHFFYLRQSGIDLDLQVQLVGGITTNLTTGGVGATDYHTHEIVFDPATSRASYYFDGTLIYQNWNGDALASYKGTYFGSYSAAGKANVNFNQVEFSAVNATSPVIVTNPVDTTVALGGSVTLTGSASGFVGGYQWYKDGVPIDGARGESYTINPATEAAEGEYKLAAYNSFEEVQSAPATVTVKPVISIGTTNGNVMVTFTGTIQSAPSIVDSFTDMDPQPASPLILTNPPASLLFRSRK